MQMQTIGRAARVLNGLVLLAVATAATAQTPPAGKSLAASAGLLAYPAKGQKPEQQTKDEAECYNWSKTQTGYDPMQPPAPPAQAAAPVESKGPAADGSRVRGAARGAAAGAVIGEVADDDAGKGAAVGATAGVLAGGRQSRKAQEQKQEQAAEQAQASNEQAQASLQALKDSFKSGMAVCLESRGYSVK